jgi:hypothetical protein
MQRSMWPLLSASRNCFRPVLFFLLLTGIIAACQNGRSGLDPIGTLMAPTLTPDSAATAWAAATRVAQPSPTSIYILGQTRANPLPAGTLISLDNWDVQVLDVLRGEPAWQLIRQANQFNTPPDPGREYLLLQLWIKNKGQSQDSSYLWLEITGDRNQIYKSYEAGVVRPEPRLETNLAPDRESLGWLAIQIPEMENAPILRLELSHGETRYLSLAAGGR